jgi:hypothetical protein
MIKETGNKWREKERNDKRNWKHMKKERKK